MRQIAPRLLTLVLAVSLSFPNPAYDRGSQALAAGNGAASSCRSHALRAPQRERRVQLAGLEDSLHGNPAWPGTPLVLPSNLLSAIPVLEPIGQGRSFLVLPLGDSPYVLKYRFTPLSPFDDLGYLFEKRDRYYHIENTIRAPLQLQELGLPQRVFVLRKIVERYPELQQFQAMGLLEVMEEPLKVRVRMKRRGLDDPDMPFEEREASLNTVILQPRVISLEDHLRGLLAAGRIDEAKASIDRYLDFTQELWKRAAYVADLDLSAIAVVDDQLKVFDAGNLLPLRPDARLPDMDNLDQGRDSRESNDDPPRNVPAGLLWIQEQVKRQLTAREGDSPALGKAMEALRDYYAQQAQDRVSSEQFMVLWGTVRTPLEQRMLAAIEEALRKDKSGLEEAEKTAQTITNLLDASKAHEREEWVHGLKEWMQDNSKPFLRLVAARVLIEQMLVDLADQNYFAGATVRSGLEKKRREAMEVRLEALKVLKEQEQTLPPAKQDLKDYIDLQVHTFLSDGSKSPAAKVWEAYRRGVKAVGINDHNTFDHFEEAIRAGEILGMTVYPSLELDFVAPELGLDKANGHALVYFPVGSLQEWEKTRARFPKELLDQVELRLKWNLMKIHKIVERFNEIHRGEGFEITTDDLRYRMGGHPNYAMVVNLLFVLERYGEKTVRDHFAPGETLDARELGKRLVKSDKRVDVDFQAALFDDEVKEGRMETEGETRLFGVRAEVLGRLAKLGGVLVLPHPKEGRFWVQYPKDKKPSWIPADYPPGYVVPVAKNPDKEAVWIAPLLLQNYPFDGIELSGKKGEATAREIRDLLDYLGKDASQFLVTVGSDTHDNEFEEAGGYQLGKGMHLGHGRWSLSKTTVRKALRGAGLNPYDEIPDRMREIFNKHIAPSAELEEPSQSGLKEFEEFRVGSLPIRISKEHDDVYRWLRELGEGGIVVLGEVDVVNIDPHPDDAVTDRVTPGSWVRFVQKEKLAKQVVKVFPTWLPQKFQELFGFEETHQFSGEVSWEEFRHLPLERPTIVTIDMDAFAPYVSDDDPGWVFGLRHTTDPWYVLRISRDDFLIDNADIRGWIDQVIEFLKSNRDNVRAVHIARSPRYTDPEKLSFIEETLRKGIQSLAGLEEPTAEEVDGVIQKLKGTPYEREKSLYRIREWVSAILAAKPFRVPDSIARNLETIDREISENLNYEVEVNRGEYAYVKTQDSGQSNDLVMSEDEYREFFEGLYDRARRETAAVRKAVGETLAVLQHLRQLSLNPPPIESEPQSGLEEKTSKAVGPLRFLVDTGKGEAGVLRLLEMAVQLKLKDGVAVQVAGVATEEELAEAEAAMPDDISRESLRARVFTYTPGDEESHQVALALAETSVPELVGIHPELIITEMNRSTVTWFLQALQRLGVNRFTQEMFDRVESYLTAA